jgi:hypothetical protein
VRKTTALEKISALVSLDLGFGDPKPEDDSILQEMDYYMSGSAKGSDSIAYQNQKNIDPKLHEFNRRKREEEEELERKKLEKQEGEKLERDRMNKMIIMIIKQIGVSLIMKTKTKQTVEINYICIQNFELAYIEQRDYKTIQMRMKNLNIDNNTDFQTLCPVNWTPSFQEEIAKNKNKYYFDICFIFDQNSDEVIKQP